MSELFPITLDDMIGAVEREIVMRRRVYPRWVSQGKMPRDKAEREIELMIAVKDALEMTR